MQEKALWRRPFEKRRCLVPADGFHEWQKITAKTKKPFVYTLTQSKPFAFAGLWNACKNPATGEWVQTSAVVTTIANKLTGQVQDRMPVILHPRGYDPWLERGQAHQLPVDLLRPYQAEAMRAEPCSPGVARAEQRAGADAGG